MDLILHVGLPKTGTSTLQSLLVGESGVIDRHASRSIVKKITSCRFMSWRELRDSAKEFCDRASEVATSEPGCPNLLLSEERLSAWYPLIGNRNRWPVGGKRNFILREGPIPIAEFIKDHLSVVWESRFNGKVKVVVTLRNQVDYLASLYVQESKFRPCASQADFERQVRGVIERDDPSIDWYGLVQDICDVVGEDNIDVLFFEKIGMEGFWNEMGSVLFRENIYEKYRGLSDSHVNKRNTRKNCWALRPYQGCASDYFAGKVEHISLYPYFRKALSFGDPILNPLVRRLNKSDWNEVCLSSDLISLVKAHCKDSNFKLSKKLNIDVFDLGY